MQIYISFFGNLNISELVNKYNTAECFILSSSSEGFPKVVLEAILSGCKVISTDVGSVSTFLPKEYIIPNNTTQNLEKHLINIIKLKKYNVDINDLREKFTWSNVIDKYEKTYKNHLSTS